MKGYLLRQEWFLTRRSFRIGGVLIVAFMAMYASIANMYTSNPDLVQSLKSMNQSFLDAFGIDVQMLTTFEGFLATQAYPFFILLLGCFACLWAAATIVKERDGGTAEYLFTLPHSRLSVYNSRVVTQFAMTTVIFIVSVGAVIGIGAATADAVQAGTIIALFTSGYLIALAFAGIGYAITAWLKSERAAISLAVGIVILSYLLTLLAGLKDNISWLADISPFRLFSAKAIVHDAALTARGIVITLVIYIAGYALGAWALRKQDL